MASLASVPFQTATFLASPSSAPLRRNTSTSGAFQVSSASFRSCPPRRLRVVAMAAPTDMNERLSKSLEDAREVCQADEASGQCAAAWDEVEELSAEIAHKRVRQATKDDPLEEYCKSAPEADECRVYED